MPTFALNFSRPGGEIICQYYNFLRLGKEGYREIQTECRALGLYLAEKIAELGPAAGGTARNEAAHRKVVRWRA